MLHGNEISTYHELFKFIVHVGKYSHAANRVVFVWEKVRLENVHPRNLSKFHISSEK